MVQLTTSLQGNHSTLTGLVHGTITYLPCGKGIASIKRKAAPQRITATARRGKPRRGSVGLRNLALSQSHLGQTLPQSRRPVHPQPCPPRTMMEWHTNDGPLTDRILAGPGHSLGRMLWP